MIKNSSIRKKWFSKIYLPVLLGIFIGIGITSIWKKTESSSLQVIDDPAYVNLKESETETDDISETRRNAIVKAAQKVGPTVVSISVIQTRIIRESPLLSPFGEDLFEEFWGRFFRPREYKQKVSSLGSGVLISEDGYVLTNEHVIRGAEELKVTLTTGEEYPGKIAGQDVASDLAVVKIDAKELPFARFGDSEDLIIGEWAIALGNPFGYLLDDSNPTVTVGVISAVNRDIKREGDEKRVYRGMIQTDASINLGNSGGPLVNARGEVIGINTFIFSTSRGSEGIGFAIPINRAKGILDDLIKHGEVTRAWIGLKVQSLNPLLASSLDLENVQGVIISEVYEKSPAHRAGFKRGDVITKVGNQRIKDVSDWEDFTTLSRVGQPLNVTSIRKGVQKELILTPGQMPLKQAENFDGLLGMTITNITAQIAGQLGISDPNGVVITSVEKGSKAYRVGFKEGDIIRQIDETHIENVKDHQNVLKSLKRNQKILMLVERDQNLYLLSLIY
ncbi:MAG: Do family serine endopeptidase [Candidatus Zixiibacteriota bacterium]